MRCWGKTALFSFVRGTGHVGCGCECAWGYILCVCLFFSCLSSCRCGFCHRYTSCDELLIELRLPPSVIKVATLIL
jgi:hypothetical protein